MSFDRRKENKLQDAEKLQRRMFPSFIFYIPARYRAIYNT